jgi:predicted outer membrane repeat protein
MKQRIISILFTICISAFSVLVIAMLLSDTIKASPSASILNVPDDFLTVQEAINHAENGDTIQISSGVYTENINISDKIITLEGVDKDTTILDGNHLGQVLVIVDNAEVILNNLTVRNGQGTQGGGIRAENSQLTIQNSLLTNNKTIDSGSSLGSGAAIFAVSTDLFINNSQLVSNTSSGSGGGIYFQSNMSPSSFEIYYTQILSNHAEVVGGGISLFNSFATPTPFISHSLIAYNTALAGGGVNLHSVTPVKITNSTISGNEGTSYGGGILAYSEVQLEHTTVFKNRTSGVHLASGKLVVSSSIIAFTYNGNDCSPVGDYSITSNGYNISSDTSCQLDQTTDISNVDPLLGPLQNNGGPTWTHAPLVNSPVLGLSSECSSTDQRNRPRSNASCDSGAYEAQPFAVDDQTIDNAPVTSITVDVLNNDLPGLAGILNLESISPPNNWTAEIVNQQIVVSPTTGFIGTEIMTYTISDNIFTATANLTVTVTTDVYLPIIIKP